ncbi:hypothetical protein [Asaia platycodi]|uniref:hypothetical protein n=1 Tax=Asaia platycodi TaxID=610243 RepID=UPI00131EEA4D|nr:hypothetical protein [Asaia platycodi]
MHIADMAVAGGRDIPGAVALPGTQAKRRVLFGADGGDDDLENPVLALEGQQNLPVG